MSSTSSSDCESCDCSQCTFSFECNNNPYGPCMTGSRHVPIYATMAQPLIYYAQVQQNRRQNGDRLKKDNPFTKAFKWYTQERKALCGENKVAPQRSGFANWLDNKYYEYMRESGQHPTSNDPRARNANTCECPKPTRAFRRFKSPWPKRTRAANDSGDVPQKYPNGSCEYILKPKELTRAASENRFLSPTSVGKSNVTVVSSHMPCNAKCSRRSQSLSDVSPEKQYVYNKPVETVRLTVQEGIHFNCECPEQQIVYPPLTKCECPQQKVPEAVQVPLKQQDSRNQPETPCTCHKEKLPAPVKVHSKEQESRNQPKTPCTCQNEKVPVREPSKEQHSLNQPVALCKCSLERVPMTVKLPSYHEEVPQVLKVQQEKIPEAVQIPLKQQDSRNQPETPCTCHKEKVPAPVKVNSKEQESRNQPTTPCACLNEKVPAIKQEPSKEQVSGNQPELPSTCQNEKVPAIKQEPSKEQVSGNQPELPSTCQNEKVLAIVREPSKEQYSLNQPVAPCKCSRERVPMTVKLPSYHEEVPQVLKVQQEKIPEVVKVLSFHKEAPQIVELQQGKMPEVVRVPSRAQESMYDLCCKCEKENVPKVIQVPSENQDPRNLPVLCCSCHVKKVPEVVQVPSQFRAVESSSQCPDKKVIPVSEETQYETALVVPPHHGPCCCNTCKPADPPSTQPLQPQIYSLPVKVQDRKISTPDICVAPCVQTVSHKKQKKVKQCISIATQCCEGFQSKVFSQYQHEINECGKDNHSSSNCNEERQVFNSKPIKRESYSTVAVNNETGEYSIMKEVAVVNKLTRCLTCASNGAAQTSDHSIRFENDGCSCPYPLLFKIVYADVE